MFKRLILSLVAVASLFASLHSNAAATADAAAGQKSCYGKMYNPMSDTNWNNVFPITVFGAPFGGNSNPPLLYMPPICICPTYLWGTPGPGIGVTYWQPMYIQEIERSPGCLSSLGAKEILTSYKAQGSEKANDDSDSGGTVSRMNVHWYHYPVFAMLDMFGKVVCRNAAIFDLAYVTEIDPTWHNDLWGIIFTPEANLFKTPVLQSVCAIDAIASTFGFPLDPLFWCAGTWGPLTPYTGNAQQTNSGQSSNGLIAAKFLARHSRVGAMLGTIGPQAICFAVPQPILIKSGYRFNHFWPTRPVVSRPLYIGQSEFVWGLLPPANFPVMESTATLIFRGTQCCIRY
jgi:conjugal transfer pilus assembly protein TraU